MRASRVSAAYGAKVAIAEPGRFGGTCVNVGCIPKKLFSYAAHWREDFHLAEAYGWTVGSSSLEPRFDWQTLLKNKDREIARLNGVYERVLVNAGVEIHRARAEVLDANSVQVNGRRYTARHILIATGSWPQLPVIPGIEHAITSNEAFALERLPQRAVVVGGGYIALEFASIFQGLGVETMLTYRGKRLLRGFDVELGTRMAEEMSAKGVTICFGCEPAAMRRREKSRDIEIEFTDGRIERTDLVMFATGRRPNTAKLGLESAGVKLAADGAVIVDRYSASSVPSIHAVGDVTNRINLTPVATAEAMWLARTLFRGEPTPVDHENVPTAVFSEPECGVIGLTEAQACEKLAKVDIYKTTFRPMKATLSGRDTRTLMKLVVDGHTDRLVGAHIVGPDAGEMIQLIGIAVKMKATKADFDATMAVHPTASEELVTMREKTATRVRQAAE